LFHRLPHSYCENFILARRATADKMQKWLSEVGAVLLRAVTFGGGMHINDEELSTQLEALA